MPGSRETILELLKYVQSVTDQNIEIFQECDKAFQAMQPELQALANRAAGLLFDDEYKTRLRGWMDSVANKRYQSSVDKLLRECSPLMADPWTFWVTISMRYGRMQVSQRNLTRLSVF